MKFKKLLDICIVGGVYSWKRLPSPERKKSMTDHHKNRNPWNFFLLTFAYSWVIWIPSVLDGIGIELPFIVTGYSIVVVIIGAFAPMMAAITLVFREEGWKGTRVFLG